MNWDIILKSKFLANIDVEFELIETLAYSSDIGYQLLDEHMRRLSESSNFFGFACNIEDILQSLNDLRSKLNLRTLYKIRIILSWNGKFEIDVSEIFNPRLENNELPIICFASKPSNSSNILFQHKTNSPSVRKFYDDEYNFCKKSLDCHEVIFVNELNQVTEGTRTNIFIEQEDVWITPPISCGLLGGVMRNSILQDKNRTAVEKILYPADIVKANKIFLTNSVSGITAVKFIGKQAP